jgi:putative (di)nucleoside polyphosphate hydrolase
MPDYTSLPYRLNVGAVLFGLDGRVLVARRAGLADAAWQLPQGGIDAGEDARAAVLRELEEEIGTAKAEILAEHPEWLQYDLPEDLVRKAFKGRYRGQRQKWFALRFLGEDSDVVLDAHVHPEFDAWKWVELAELPDLAVAFKRDIYEILARDFAIYARS